MGPMRDSFAPDDFCPRCNQYGCHTPTCPRRQWLDPTIDLSGMPYHGPEECPEAELREELEQARSDYEVMRIENFSLANQLRMLQQKHTEELSRLLRRLALMEDLVTKRQLEQI